MKDKNAVLAQLTQLTPDVLSRTMYVFGKQDYPYRQLDAQFKGTMPLQFLRDFEVCILKDEAEQPFRDEFSKVMKEPAAEYSLLDCLGYDEDSSMVLDLLQHSSIIVMDEVGYLGFSLVSMDEAKKVVQQAYLEENGLGSEAD